MSVDIRYALTTDGPFDRVIRYHIEWALQRICDCCSFAGEWVDPRVFDGPAATLAGRVSKAIANYPCNLLFIHRDSEQADPKPRYAEISDGLRLAGVGTRSVAVVPIRMTEAWLLVDEPAIRRASGNPNGTTKLPLPAIGKLEQTADPKRLLEECLEIASEKTGRRLEIFKRELPSMKHRVAELIGDFAPLLALDSFQRFYDDLANALSASGLCEGHAEE